MEPITSLMSMTKAEMCFKLADGNIIWISKEDVQELASRIILEGMISNPATVVVVKHSNLSIQKADQLYKTMKDNTDMKPELKNRYLKEIADLLSVSNTTYEANGVEMKIIQK